MASLLEPLSIQVPIVDPKTGTPTPQFQRLLQLLSLSAELSETNGEIGIKDGGITNAKLANMANHLIKARKAAGTGVPEDVSLSDVLDFLASTQGDILFRGASSWKRLAVGAAGLFLKSQGAGADLVWATAGVGGTPTVRASNIQSSSNSSYTVTWPTGTVAGDVVLIFGGHGFGFNNPTNWTVLDNETGGNFNGVVLAKVMTAADITAGSVTITTAGGFNGVLSAVTIDGTTMTGIRQPSAFVRSSGGPSAATATTISNQSGLSTDLIITFAATRATGNVTFSSGITSLQAINAASASGAVGKFTGTLTALGMAETWQCSAAGSGYYTAAVALR